MSFKTTTLFLACTMAISVGSLTAYADQSSSVCNDPLQRICADTLGQRKERDKYVKALKEEISIEANKNANPRIEEMKKKISKFHFLKRMIQSYKIRNQEIMNAAKKRIGGVESVITNPENIKKLKSYMARSIDSSSFDSATKANMKSIEDSVVVGNFSDYIEKSGLEDSVLAQLLSNACGSDGLIDNAFATTLKGERYVLVCPGFLITLSQTANDSDRFNSILHAISHEMGHHIDNSKIGNALYAPYLNCLAKNYSSKFNKSKDDEKFCKTAKTSEECNLKVATSHAGELIADQWGLSATNIHMRSQNYSSFETDQLLADSWAKLCGTGDEGIHPTGDFRIGTLLRTNPDITQYLGCNNSSVNLKPACTFDGETQI